MDCSFIKALNWSSSAMATQRSRNLLVVIVEVAILIHCVLSQTSTLKSSIERRALLDLRSSLGIRGKDWPIKANPCRYWNGVQCRNGSVTGITVSGLKRTRAGRGNRHFRVDSLANLTRLEVFNASGFSLPGSIPNWFGNRMVHLRVLDLRSCSVSGSVPPSIGNLSRLSLLYLSGNNLAGDIPFELGKLMELTDLDLSRNSFTRLIPQTFSRNLLKLDLSSNYLPGQIPIGITTLYALKILNLSNNSLTGSIPGQLGNLSKLLELDFSKNSLSGSLVEELKGLSSLRRMVLRENELEGPLPNGVFASLTQLRVLDLCNNKLDGSLANVSLFMPELHMLDVSRNNFTGPFPSLNLTSNGAMFNLSNNFLYGTLSFSFRDISWLDLSSNYFQGQVIDADGSKGNATLDNNCLQIISNQRSLDDCRMFYDERTLKFDDFGAMGPIQPLSSQNAKKPWLFILVGLLSGVFFIVVLAMVLILIVRKCNKRTTNHRGVASVGFAPEGDDNNPSLPDDPIITSSMGDSFTYRQLLNATGDFKETCLLKHGHSGDLFRGVLDGGVPIVIKKIHPSFLTKEAYMMELDVFNKVSHTRLVPLMGHCWEHESEKLLVYKYMQNGDLANSLHKVTNLVDDGLKSLDWITRIKIAIGAAEGLSFLHHECTPPLVHRDVQASSILLDDKFEVRLGSLSEVCVQEGDPHQKGVTRLLRKSQSFEASSSASSSTATCAYDVHCFGKVLLELVTGKIGISSRIPNETTTQSWWLDQTLPYITIHDKESLNKILDPSLILDDDLLEEVWAMAIVAKSCLNPKPSKRPPMKYVLKALENPLKIVRAESFNSARLRRTTAAAAAAAAMTNSSRRSWNTTLFGSWRQNSIDSGGARVGGEGLSGLKQSDRVGSGIGSGMEHSSSRKRLSNEIFPEPVEMQEIERGEEH